MFARHVAPCRVALARHRAAHTVPLAATWSSTLGRRNVSQLSQSSSRISTVFGALLAAGVATTGYGLYQFYSTFTVWPKEIRSDLRAGVKAKHYKDFDLSERYIRRAWETAQTLPIAVYDPDPHLKLTGILITLAEVTELNGKPHEAYELMSNYLDNLPPLDEEATYHEWSGAERMRLAAMAHKLGLMAESYSRPQKDQEKWLTWAVERTLKDIRRVNESSGRSAPGPDTSQPLHELELPDWVSRSDLLVLLESLGEFHARTNKTSLAITLNNQVLTILQANFGDPSKLKNLCHAAQVLSNQSELYSRPSLPKEGKVSPEVLLQGAESSALSSLKIIAFVQDNPDPNQDTSACETTFGVAMANLATINTIKGNLDMAQKLYETALKHAVKTGNKDQIRHIRSLLLEVEKSRDKGATR